MCEGRNPCRGFSGIWQDTYLDLMKRGFLRGLSEKWLLLPPLDRTELESRGPSAGGLWQRRFRRLEHEGLGQEGENEEESTGNSREHSPTGKTAGNRSTPATGGSRGRLARFNTGWGLRRSRGRGSRQDTLGSAQRCS
jgi:hypothetical protein